MVYIDLSRNHITECPECKCSSLQFINLLYNNLKFGSKDPKVISGIIKGIFSDKLPLILKALDSIFGSVNDVIRIGTVEANYIKILLIYHLSTGLSVYKDKAWSEKELNSLLDVAPERITTEWQSYAGKEVKYEGSSNEILSQITQVLAKKDCECLGKHDSHHGHEH